MSGNDAAAAKTAKIAVWWDMFDCPVPEGIDARRVRPSLEGAFKELLGYSGPVSITAYGDQKQTPKQLLRALSSTGVAVVHTRPGCTCAVMYKDMVAWREDNPPPAAKMMIISNQVLDVFNWDLCRLQQRTFYDLFLAYSVEPRAGLHVRTRKEWLWEKLLTTSAAGESSSSSSAKKFYCKSCSLDRRSLKSFKKHLFTKKHALQEILRPDDSQLQSVTSKWGKNYAATPEFATAKIHVWWDMYDCPIPDDGYDARRIRPSLEGAFKELGYSGPVSITAYGDHEKTPQHHLQALSSTGIHLAHATLEVVNGRMSDDIDEWDYNNNSTPATMMIISDEADYAFSDFLPHLLQGNKYNLFLAYSFRPREMSVLVTSAEWLWDSLLAETRRHVLLRKCSGSSSIERVGESTGMFYCKVCFSDFKHLDQFMKHLSSKKHARIGKRIADNIEDSENLQLYWLERHHFPESKRFKKAPL